MAERGRRREPLPGVPRRTPAAVRRQIEGLIDSLGALLGDNLRAVYLHGSLAAGGFQAKSSDIDLLVVVERPLLRDRKLGLAQTLLERSGIPAPIELSVLARDDVQPWRHPAPYQFHYSEGWCARIQADTAATAWLGWPDGAAGVDRDLALHLAMARTSGVALLGPPPADLLPDVPRGDILDAIVYDLEEAERRILEMPVYAVLNIVRGLRYVREQELVSKDAGGVWALAALPEAQAAQVARALAVRRGETSEMDWDAAALRRFARDLIGEIRDAVEGV
jgi:predicted nucleotidyltransferase